MYYANDLRIPQAPRLTSICHFVSCFPNTNLLAVCGQLVSLLISESAEPIELKPSLRLWDFELSSKKHTMCIMPAPSSRTNHSKMKHSIFFKME